MAQVITLAGEKLFATKAQANQQLDIDTFIFANVAGQDPAAAIDRNEGIPTNAIVHQQNVQQTGRINDNVVVYSTVLDSVTGPFEFNWVGLYSSVNQTLVAISHVPTVAKTITAPGSAGNTLNRNFGIEYSGIADLAGISVSPETWQLDFTARLSGMDELTRNLAKDLNGTDSFIDNGFKVESRKTENSFSVLAGVGYVNGLRVELEEMVILTASTYPQNIYVDAYFDGDDSSAWKPKHGLRIVSDELTNYIDETGKQHYLVKIAEVTSTDEIKDLRNLFNDFALIRTDITTLQNDLEIEKLKVTTNKNNIEAEKEKIRANENSISEIGLNLGSVKSTVITHGNDIAGLKTNQQSGVLVFQNYALLDAYTPVDATEQKASYKVVNDPNRSLNGYYYWVSDNTYAKDASIIKNELDLSNTSDPVSGSAVLGFSGKQVRRLSLADIQTDSVNLLSTVENSGAGSRADIDILNDSFTYRKENANYSWLTMDAFTPDVTKVVNINFYAEVDNDLAFPTVNGVKVILTDENSFSGNFQVELMVLVESGKVSLSFDPAEYYNQYGTTQFRIIFNNSPMQAGDYVQAKIMNYRVTQDVTKAPFDNLDGNTSKELFESVDRNFSNGVNLSRVSNGDITTLSDIETLTENGPMTELDIANNSFVYTKTGVGNSWIVTNKFTPSGSNIVTIKFDVVFSNIDSYKGLQLVVAGGTRATDYYNMIGTPITEDGSVTVTFDPAYYTVYHGLTSFYVWINNQTGQTSTETVRATISNFRIYEANGAVSGTYIDGDNAKQLFEATDSAIGNIDQKVGRTPTVTAADGKKYEIGATTTGEIKLLPMVPTKAAYFGNSLISGFGDKFAMASSAITNGYYQLINNYILTLNPQFTATGQSASVIENIASPEHVAANVQLYVTDKLDGDETLVVVQLGDNVSAGAIDNWPFMCLSILQAIRGKCPNARVFWMGMWYGGSVKYDAIIAACEATGSTFVNIGALRNISGSMASIGDLINRGSETRVLENVTSVTENSPTEIVFDMAGRTITMPVSSYSLSGSTLTYTGNYYVITTGGVASHPSDYGFRLIANKFLLESQITTNEAIYSN
ncbi:hypothetical protein FGD67_06235 [Colwellia sp. M166]|uniref:phage tail protein n=1 Tax=Colwellia sp. M166 TaxID=2583805 RepID=UPI00211EFF7F|nr:phage tail protein [Colwellia sp. M166]UUO22829.1 hypothetical protein FGD67_06235 [Colwellia sp. M166]